MRRPWARGSRELTETEIGLGPAAGTVALVAIDRIVEPSWRPDTPDNGRDFLTVAASVSVKGISQPVVLRRRRRGDYELVDGGRRVRAARANGLCEVPALIADLSDLEALLTGWDAIVRFGVSDDQRIDLAARLAAAGLPLDQINHRLASAPFRIHIEPREDTTHGDAVAFAGDDDATVVHNQEAPSAMRDHADARTPADHGAADRQPSMTAALAHEPQNGGLVHAPERATVQIAESDPLTILFDLHTIERGGKKTRLTWTEWQLFAFFLRNPGTVHSRWDLAAGAWGPAFLSHQNEVEMYISRLRRKVEVDPRRPRLIVTVRGAGYRLATAPEPDGDAYRLNESASTSAKGAASSVAEQPDVAPPPAVAAPRPAVVPPPPAAAPAEPEVVSQQAAPPSPEPVAAVDQIETVTTARTEAPPATVQAEVEEPPAARATELRERPAARETELEEAPAAPEPDAAAAAVPSLWIEDDAPVATTNAFAEEMVRLAADVPTHRGRQAADEDTESARVLRTAQMEVAWARLATPPGEAGKPAGVPALRAVSKQEAADTMLLATKLRGLERLRIAGVVTEEQFKKIRRSLLSGG